MAFKGNLECDPRGLIYEAYRMDIGEQECRSIFLDWVLGTQIGEDLGKICCLLENFYK